MSLIKQLWIAIGCMMLLAFGGSFLVSALSAQQVLTQQLQLKNIDNATSLALSMSQLDKDPITIELLVAAQFDAGHYQRITLTDPEGRVMVERAQRSATTAQAPQWFQNWVPIHAEAGEALVQDGWEQYGTLTVLSHSGYAVDALWQSTVRLLQWFVAMGLFCGLLGTWFLKSVSRPLDTVVQQAEAIGDRRFIRSDEPRIHEFKRLVSAMNLLSERVRDMLEKETRQLDTLRRRLQHDDLTGLPNREHFFNVLDGQLAVDTTDHDAALLIIRVMNLQDVNTQLGRVATDQFLKDVARVLQQVTDTHGQCFSGRLNGSDFILLIPSLYDPQPMAKRIRQTLDELLDRLISTHPEDEFALPLACCEFDESATRGKLMMQLDGALAEAEQNGPRGMVMTTLQQREAPHANLDEWRLVLEEALTQVAPDLASYPVRTLQGELFHTEVPARWQLDGALRPARYFVPWMARLGLLPKMDLCVTQEALRMASLPEHQNTRLAVNIATESVQDTGFRQALLKLLESAPKAAQQLDFECHEFCAIRHAQAFRVLCNELQACGARIGLEHVGPEFARLENLQDLGLSYIKIDHALIRNIQQDSGNQTFVRGLCSIGHSLGITMIAQGVTTADDVNTLADLGLDAQTGTAVR